jgi:hypothetical protein
MNMRPEGVLRKFRYERRFVWWKPWTWLGRPTKVVDEGELIGLFFVLPLSDKESVVRRDTGSRWDYS